jgi:hypothetical protein
MPTIKDTIGTVLLSDKDLADSGITLGQGPLNTRQKIFALLPEDQVVYYPNLTRIVSYDDDVIIIESIVSVFESGTLPFDQVDFPDLTEADYDFAININLVQQLGEMASKSVIESVTQYINDVQREQTILYKKFLPSIPTLYKKAIKLHPDASLYNQISQSTIYESLLITCKSDPVDLQEKLDSMQPTRDVPIIGMVADKEPIVKVFKPFLKEKEAETLLFNDKQVLAVKRYGLLMYMLINFGEPEFISHKVYVQVYLNANGLVTARIDFKEGLASSFEQIQEILFTHLEKAGIKCTNGRLESCTVDIKTKEYIDKEALKQVLTEKSLESILELRPVTSETFVSFVHVESGAVVNVFDNRYDGYSSYIRVYNTQSVKSAESIAVIVLRIYSIARTLGIDTKEFAEQTVTKSNIKELRSRGIKVQSKECQKKFQPVINVGDALPNSYTLYYDNNEYNCDNALYPYPGFTKNDIVCCFKKDQRNKTGYLRNMSIHQLTTIVQPSNLEIVVGKDKTFAIKNVSENGAIYYLDKFKNFVKVKDDTVLKRVLEKEQKAPEGMTIWLKKTTLSTLIVKPYKNKCLYIPDMNAEEACAAHPGNNVFVYNTNSYPCCSNKPRPLYNTIKEDVPKGHIIISNKILEPGRLGTLPSQFDLEKYNRYGVIQDKSSLLYTLIAAGITKHDIPETFRIDLVSYAKEQDLFYLLDAGRIYSKYNNFANYSKHLLEDVLDDNDIDLLQRYTGVSIIVYHIDDAKMECLINRDYKSFVIVMEQGGSNELVVSGSKRVFTAKDKFVTLLLRLLDTRCETRENIPKKYPFDELMSAEDVMSMLEDKVIGQILTGFKRTSMLVLRKGIIVPVKERVMIPDVPEMDIADIIADTSVLPSVNRLLKGYASMPILNLSIRGVTLDEGVTTSVLTNTGIHIPVAPRLYGGGDDLEVLPYKWYLNAFDIRDDYNKSPMYAFVAHNTSLMDEYTRIEKEFVSNATNETIESINKIVKSKMISKGQRIDMLESIITNAITKPNKFVSQVLANDMLNVGYLGILQGRVQNRKKRRLKVFADQVILRTFDDFVIARKK